MSKSDGISFKQNLWGYINEFTLFALVGWLYETVCESIFAGRFVLNRGLLHLPVCPIYGVGAFVALWIMSLLARGNRPKLWQIFLGGVVITTVVEYIAALLIEATLHKTLWDYTAWVCNFQGRVSLISSLIFGLGCVGAYKIRPICEKYCREHRWTGITAVVFAVAMLVDLVIVTVIE
jgi:uncharacterized membrane protein